MSVVWWPLPLMRMWSGRFSRSSSHSFIQRLIHLAHLSSIAMLSSSRFSDSSAAARLKAAIVASSSASSLVAPSAPAGPAGPAAALASFFSCPSAPVLLPGAPVLPAPVLAPVLRPAASLSAASCLDRIFSLSRSCLCSPSSTFSCCPPTISSSTCTSFSALTRRFTRSTSSSPNSVTGCPNLRSLLMTSSLLSTGSSSSSSLALAALALLAASSSSNF
mmetsp:Transcript_7488/g.18555  ORF Transcript_7488/g.18555 Transcript_7488/m.18555 type:complete len:219 (-) Transcript_7488:270-926(-)